MHVVLAPLGSRGDVQPIIALAVALREAGHTSTICAAPDYGEWIEGLGLSFHPVGESFQEFLERRAGDVTRHPLAASRSMKAGLREMTLAFTTELARIAQGADLLVGAGLQIAAGSVAEKLGIPYRFTVYCPQILESATHPMFLVRSQRPPVWVNRLSWWFYRRIFDGMYRGIINECRGRLGLRPINTVYDYLALGEVLAASDEVLAKMPEDVPVRFVQTGAWLLSSREVELPEEVERFLRAGPPPVYVGFGSMPDTQPERTTRLVLEAVRGAGCRALISQGWAKLAGGTLPEGCLALGNVPHDVLFPRLAAIVHHGGAGTTAIASRAGVPQVVVSHLADQFFWGWRVHEQGVAPRPIFRSALTAARLQSALVACLTDEDMKTRARQLGEKLRQGQGTQLAVRHLEALVASRAMRSAAAAP